MVPGNNRSPEGFRERNSTLLFNPVQPAALVIEDQRIADRVPEAGGISCAGLVFHQHAVELFFDLGCVPIDDIHFDTSLSIIPFIAETPELQIQIRPSCPQFLHDGHSIMQRDH